MRRQLRVLSGSGKVGDLGSTAAIAIGWLVQHRYSSSSGGGGASSPSSSSLLTLRGLVNHKTALQDELDAKRRLLHEATLLKQRLELQALKHPDTLAFASFAYFASQTALLFYWVYYRFDWNLVEPITYLLGYSAVWLGIGIYYATGKSFTYDNVRSMLADRKAQKLFQTHCFDVAEYEALKSHVDNLERRVAQLSQLP